MTGALHGSPDVSGPRISWIEPPLVWLQCDMSYTVIYTVVHESTLNTFYGNNSVQFQLWSAHSASKSYLFFRSKFLAKGLSCTLKGDRLIRSNMPHERLKCVRSWILWILNCLAVHHTVQRHLKSVTTCIEADSLSLSLTPTPYYNRIPLTAIYESLW